MPLPFVTTGIVRLTRIRLFNEELSGNRKKRYYAVVLLPKNDTATWQLIMNSIADTVKIALDNNWRDLFLEHIAMPIKDGDGPTITGATFGPECAGHMVINTFSFVVPDMVDMYLRPIADPTDDIYDGIYAHVLLQFFPQISNGVPGISCVLRAIMKVADGERILWNRSPAQRAFSEIVNSFKHKGQQLHQFHNWHSSGVMTHSQSITHKKQVTQDLTLIPPKADINDNTPFEPELQTENAASSPWDDEKYKEMLETMKNRALSFDEFKELTASTISGKNS